MGGWRDAFRPPPSRRWPRPSSILPKLLSGALRGASGLIPSTGNLTAKGRMAKRRLAAGRLAALAGAVFLLGSLATLSPRAVAATPLPPVLNILPPGENGLVNPLQAV